MRISMCSGFLLMLLFTSTSAWFFFEDIGTEDDDSANGDGEIVGEDGRSTSGEKEIASGDGEIVSGDGEVVSGDGEIVSGDREIVSGDGEIASGDRESASGDREMDSSNRQPTSEDRESAIVDGAVSEGIEIINGIDEEDNDLDVIGAGKGDASDATDEESSGSGSGDSSGDGSGEATGSGSDEGSGDNNGGDSITDGSEGDALILSGGDDRVLTPIGLDTVMGSGQSNRVISSKSVLRETIVFIKKDSGTDKLLYMRGGNPSAQGCTDSIKPESDSCSIPIEHAFLGLNVISYDREVQSEGDHYLSWGVREEGQPENAIGTPALRTTNETGDTYYSPQNRFGSNYFMARFYMDCSATSEGFFEVKAVDEQDISPFECTGDAALSPSVRSSRGGHLAQCGCVNVFTWGESRCHILRFLPE